MRAQHFCAVEIKRIWESQADFLLEFLPSVHNKVET